MKARPSATALLHAIEADDAASLARWLDAGLSPEVAHNGSPVLHTVAVNACPRLLALLLARGADPSGPLVDAVGQGSVRVAKQLLAAGADLEAGARFCKRHPLSVAAGRGRAPLVKLLLAAGADPRRRFRGESALEACAQGGDSQGHLACARLLLAAGADSRAALKVAERAGRARMAALLRRTVP